jgi:pyruvate dehydrogenase E2 component (dihydrolipoamide acetyltransferase)/2-oxoisovalerate dehydrogenase E2 component (dihydrolipoyl transacylase)
MQFKLPELGEGVYEGEAVRWLVQAGDDVKPGQTVLEVLTDKATMEVPVPFAGVIDKLLVKEGDKLEIGQPILEYQEKGAAKPAESEEDGHEIEEKESKAKGEPESKPKAKPETEDKPRPKPEIEDKPKAKPQPATKPAPGKEPVHAAPHGNGPPPVKAAPTIRLMARKLGVDLARVRGSGPDGRILIDDLSRQVATTGAAKPAIPHADFGKPGARIKLVGIRRKIAEHMALAQQTIPHYAYVDECDVTDLVKLRTSLKEPFATKGTKLTYLAFFVKAVVAALQEVPIANASLDEGAGEILLHDHYHIGIAVAAPTGLIVPVIHDADKKSLAEIAAEIERLSTDARAGKSKLEDLKGGTFTVTSIGNIGGLFSAPIINHPEVGILGVGKIVKRPMFDEHGQVHAADMVYLSFSFDHRVLDGAIGAAFGNAVIAALQNPGRMLL